MPEIDNEPLIELARHIRLSLATRRWTVGALERRAGLGHTTVSQALNGRLVPSERTVAALAHALGGDTHIWLALREAAERHEETLNEPVRIGSENGVILDVGAIQLPNASIAWSEVRFSLSNLTSSPLKVVQIFLETVKCVALEEMSAVVVAAPVMEYFLQAQLTEAVGRLPLLPRHHVLGPGDTDGFFLRIDGVEGRAFRLRLIVIWHYLGDAACSDNTTIGPAFWVQYSPRSPAGMLEMVRRVRLSSNAEGSV
jgi:transcriptional regulator with XRE-family HTH domain